MFPPNWLRGEESSKKKLRQAATFVGVGPSERFQWRLLRRTRDAKGIKGPDVLRGPPPAFLTLVFLHTSAGAGRLILGLPRIG